MFALLARTVHLDPAQMAAMLRVLLWTAVIVAPGGVLLLPFLAAGTLRQRAKLSATQQPLVGP